MSSLFIIVQTRESDKKAVHLLRYLMEKGAVKVDRPLQDIDPNTVIISFQSIQYDETKRIISDSKQWADDVGFVFLVNEDAVYSIVSQSSVVEKENTTVISMLEL